MLVSQKTQMVRWAADNVAATSAVLAVNMIRAYSKAAVIGLQLVHNKTPNWPSYAVTYMSVFSIFKQLSVNF